MVWRVRVCREVCITMKKQIVVVLVTLLFASLACSFGAQGQKATPQDVIDGFKAAGLEAENIRPMAKDDYGLAPMADEGIRFFIPSLGPDKGGRVMRYSDQETLKMAKEYYDAFCKKSAALFSWAFVNGDILIQINGDLPEEQAKKYEAVLMGIGK